MSRRSVAVGSVGAVVAMAMAVGTAAAVMRPDTLTLRTAESSRLAPPSPPTPPPAPPTELPKKHQPRKVTARVGMTVTPNGTSLHKVGVGYPLMVTFGTEVGRKAAVERGLVVTVDGAPVPGAWSWLSRTTVMYRPRHGFWPAHARIRLHADLARVVLARDGKHKNKLLVGNKRATRTVTYRTARAFVAHINDRTHRMVVRKDGRKLRSIPVSMGMPAYRTRSGIKVVSEKYAMKRMTNQEMGYDVMSPYAVRITPTGEFIHGAPWAYGRIGRWDGSHGCVNLFVSDAEWYYDRVMLGDPVVTKNTGRPMEWNNGLGGPWNIPWKVWLKRSALKGATD